MAPWRVLPPHRTTRSVAGATIFPRRNPRPFTPGEGGRSRPTLHRDSMVPGLLARFRPPPAWRPRAGAGWLLGPQARAEGGAARALSRRLRALRRPLTAGRAFPSGAARDGAPAARGGEPGRPPSPALPQKPPLASVALLPSRAGGTEGSAGAGMRSAPLVAGVGRRAPAGARHPSSARSHPSTRVSSGPRGVAAEPKLPRVGQAAGLAARESPPAGSGIGAGATV